jgi:hypothetical protein
MLGVRRTSASNLDIERIDAARLDPHQRLTFTGSWPHDCEAAGSNYLTPCQTDSSPDPISTFSAEVVLRRMQPSVIVGLTFFLRNVISPAEQYRLP